LTTPQYLFFKSRRPYLPAALGLWGG